MCFSGNKQSAPQITAVPEPAPLPTPAPIPTVTSPTSVTSITDAEKRRKSIASMRFGLMSTIKTSPQGIKTGPDLYTPVAEGQKKLMGQ